MSSVFSRSPHPLPVAGGAEGAWITTSDGRRILDAAGGAIVCGVGHGRSEVADAIATQLRTVDYVHASTFTTEVLERYAHELSRLVPVDAARVFPVAGGSEATETAFKLARSFHLARGEPERQVILSRWGSYHGNTLAALDASGREGLRAGYDPWLGRVEHLPALNEFRCPNPAHPRGCGRWHAERLEERILELGPARVAAFVAEAVGGATLGAAVPSDDYWSSVSEVCRRHGVLLIVDEVMSGFGRTGTWFASQRWSLSPDVLVLGKGCASGYWPLGLAVASGQVADAVAGSFRHGFTYSHHPAGAAAGLAVLRILREEGLVERSAAIGARLREGLAEALATHPLVADVRGIGLLVAVEVVADRSSAAPFPRSANVTERLVREAFDAGLTVYPLAGCADGREGDGILLGPPLTLTSAEVDLVIERVAVAVEAVAAQL